MKNEKHLKHIKLKFEIAEKSEKFVASEKFGFDSYSVRLTMHI